MGRWFSSVISISPTNKTDSHDITEIVLKVALNTIAPYTMCLCQNLLLIQGALCIKTTIEIIKNKNLRKV
jgi:hypothetical protein